ncbi:hypothetical protein BDZ91DRAFT_767317 [Kalaharituber pfeilii]|nr:hypothetical protein BDZ91DRAFT_767317 [Kalaharituber pfeilii]
MKSSPICLQNQNRNTGLRGLTNLSADRKGTLVELATEEQRRRVRKPMHTEIVKVVSRQSPVGLYTGNRQNKSPELASPAYSVSLLMFWVQPISQSKKKIKNPGTKYSVSAIEAGVQTCSGRAKSILGSSGYGGGGVIIPRELAVDGGNPQYAVCVLLPRSFLPPLTQVQILTYLLPLLQGTASLCPHAPHRFDPPHPPPPTPHPPFPTPRPDTRNPFRELVPFPAPNPNQLFKSSGTSPLLSQIYVDVFFLSAHTRVQDPVYAIPSTTTTEPPAPVPGAQLWWGIV